MAPVLILIRHAQALHNVASDWSLPDPPLSDLGHQQCQDLQEHFMSEQPLAEQIDFIVASPMRRTLQTTQESLKWLIKKGVKIEGDARWQETSDKPCDTGSSILIIKSEFPELAESGTFDSVDPAYPSKDGEYAFNNDAIISRGVSALRDIRKRPENVVAVVSHSGFLRTAIGQAQWSNADYRIFDFTDSDEYGSILEERQETEVKGGGRGTSETGKAPVLRGDFPNNGMEKVRSHLGERTHDEATNEVPN